MTEQNQNPAGTDDVQGHFRRGQAADTEGARNTRARGMADGEDDTQGHGGRGYPSEAGDVEGTDDDTEGHTRR
jgi:hypothetical protein